MKCDIHSITLCIRLSGVLGKLFQVVNNNNEDVDMLAKTARMAVSFE